MSSLTLRQQTEITTDALFRVTDSITASEDIDDAVFVFKTTDDAFSHYATVTDLVLYPDTKAEALDQGVGFYRQNEAIRDWDDIDSAREQKALTVTRLRSLLIKWDDYSEGFEDDVTVVISTDEE